MTDDKKVADVTKERMLSDVLRQLRATQQMLREIDENRRKLIESGCEYEWYPDYTDRTWKDIKDNIDLCLMGLGECTENKINKQNKNKETED